MDPATKQYVIFSAIISLIISFILSFILPDLLKGSIFYGFPISLSNSSGLGEIFLKTINTLILTFFLTFLVYYALMWYLRKR